MKALRVHRFGGPEVLQVDEVADPLPAAGEVLIEVRAAGVNPVDTYVRSGTYERLPPLPYVPGGDAAGVVMAVGKGVGDFEAGDRVYTAGGSQGLLTGACAERMVVRESQLRRLPQAASFAQGAALGVPWATAFRGLVQIGGGRSGETVFVHGASGSVGLAAVQIACARGLDVLGSAGTPEGLDLVRDAGASQAFDHTAEGYLAAVRQATGGDGPDLILEMAAHLNLDRDLELAAPGGRIVIIGSRGRVEVDPRAALSKDLTVRGFALSSSSPEAMDEIHRGLFSGLESGAFVPLVGAELPLADGGRGHLLAVEPGVYGKVVLLP
ncbi:MAG: NADPH:quinone reductase [Acidobacteriota bacterium]